MLHPAGGLSCRERLLSSPFDYRIKNILRCARVRAPFPAIECGERFSRFRIRRALLTCDATNTASRRIIEKNGGVLENQIPNPETGVDKLRFLIDIL
jgi:hypothetical protein